MISSLNEALETVSWWYLGHLFTLSFLKIRTWNKPNTEICQRTILFGTDINHFDLSFLKIRIIICMRRNISTNKKWQAIEQLSFPLKGCLMLLTREWEFQFLRPILFSGEPSIIMFAHYEKNEWSKLDLVVLIDGT